MQSTRTNGAPTQCAVRICPRSIDQQPADADGMPLELVPDPGVELLKLPDPVVLGIGAV
jgi:hypothetical protein